MVPQRQFPIRAPHHRFFPFALPFSFSFPLPLDPFSHAAAQSIKRRRARRHGAFHPARGARRGRDLVHLPRALVRGLGVRFRGRRQGVLPGRGARKSSRRARGHEGVQGQGEKGGEEDAQHDGDGEAGLGLLAVAAQAGPHGGSAASGDVPRRARLRLVWVGHVGRGLGVDADGEEGDEGGVDDGGEERVEDVADVHDGLDEEEEEGDDGDDDVEVRHAGRGISFPFFAEDRVMGEYTHNWLHGKGVLMGR